MKNEILYVPDVDDSEMAGRYATALVSALEIIQQDAEQLPEQERKDLGSLTYFFVAHLAKVAGNGEKP